MSEEEAVPGMNTPTIPPTAYAYRVDTYVDDQGRRVTRRTQALGEAPEGFVPYLGGARIMLEVGPRRGTHQFVFDIRGASTLVDAFAKFDAARDEAAKFEAAKIQADLRRQQQQQGDQIILPGASPLPLPPPPDGRKGRRGRL